MTTARFAPTIPIEISAAGYEAWKAGREFIKLLDLHGRRAEPTALAEAYRDAAETAFEDVISAVQPRPAD
ncbi:hypothetical protein ACFVVA_36935 [Kitasatospora sp. NPDC058048]|uniref:hypothetical protein n=1 Tax=Kitasatospora sp. NPDC058048 TaxID=3346313 RepID=UPI0036DC88CF